MPSLCVLSPSISSKKSFHTLLTFSVYKTIKLSQISLSIIFFFCFLLTHILIFRKLMESDSSPPRDRVKGFKSIAMVDRSSGEGFISGIRENASSVLQLLAQLEEYEKALELKQVSTRKELLELKEKEERLQVFEERESKFEDSMVERLRVFQEKEKKSYLKQLLEASVIRLAIETQNEEVVTQLKAQEDFMVRKYEEIIREVEAREKAVSLREVDFQQRQNAEANGIEEKKKSLEVKEKELEELIREVKARDKELSLLHESIKEKSIELEMKKGEFQQRQNAESKEIEEKKTFLEVEEKGLKELMRMVEERCKELSLLHESFKEKSIELEKKEGDFQQKQNAEAKEIEEKIMFLERKEKELEDKMKDFERRQRELEERSVEAETRKRFRLESEPSLLAEKGRDTESAIPTGKKHKPIREYNSNDEEKKEIDLDFVLNGKTSSDSAAQHTSQAKGKEFVETICDDPEPFNCADPDTNEDYNNTLTSTSEAKGREVSAIVCRDEDPEPIDCPDPDFKDFSNTINSFAKSQVWALYDPVDAMPRYYALIESVSKPKLIVNVRWLESVHNRNEKLIPIACGNFKHGALAKRSLLMFSHQMHRTIIGKNVTIYPRTGETWALFRDWDKSWITNREQHKPPYRYDIVEVESDFDNVNGIGVVYLGMVEGFTSVYQQAEQHGVIKMMISTDEMIQFSHRVPSFRMTGDEKEGVPAGSFELDPAALPRGLFAVRKEEAMVLV